ncbi:MAG: SLOG family protein [Eubacteriales bacterium]
MIILNKNAKCCITGYNSNKLPYGEDRTNPDCTAMLDRLKQAIIEQLDKGVYQFYIGMDCGVELWSAEILLSLKDNYPPLEIYPILSSEELANEWSDDSHSLFYDTVMPNCEDEFRISNHHTDDCVSRRNKWLAEKCNLFLAVYDGQENTSVGEILGLAMKKEIILIEP